MNLQKSSRTGTRQDLMKMIMTMMMRITLALTLTRMEENEYDEEKNLAISLFFLHQAFAVFSHRENSL